MATKDLNTIAKEVISGKWGNGSARKTNLTKAGYNYSEVQALVNSMLGSGSKSTTTTNKTTTNTPTTTPTTTSPSTNNTFKASDTTNAYKNTYTQKQAELDKLGTFTYNDYAASDIVNDAWNKLNALQHPGEFQYGNQQMLEEAFNKIMNGEKFSYDINGDALYQQYKDQYVNQGKLAMQDAMGQAAAMTGGYGNSYAQSVGQQTYQGYLQQLNDKIPELYQLALNKYNMERQDLKDQYGLLKDDRNYEYGIHRDAVSDYNTERAYLTEQARWLSEDDYNKHVTGEDQRFNEYSTQYGAITDALDLANENYWNSLGVDFNTYTDDRDYNYKVEQDKIANDLALQQLQLDKDKFEESKKKIVDDDPDDDSPVYDDPVGDDPDANEYKDWDGLQWREFFDKIRLEDGQAAAEKELNDMASKGLIPQIYVPSAALGARGGKLGH